jgi:hypothetical protein
MSDKAVRMLDSAMVPEADLSTLTPEEMKELIRRLSEKAVFTLPNSK